MQKCEQRKPREALVMLVFLVQDDSSTHKRLRFYCSSKCWFHGNCSEPSEVLSTILKIFFCFFLIVRTFQLIKKKFKTVCFCSDLFQVLTVKTSKFTKQQTGWKFFGLSLFHVFYEFSIEFAFPQNNFTSFRLHTVRIIDSST